MLIAILIYSVWVLAAVSIIVIGVYVSLWSLGKGINSDSPVLASIAILAAIVLGWIGIYRFCSYVFRPFASFQKKESEGEEIFAKDYPDLFAEIISIAAATGNKEPKHVYLTDEANASVCYDNLWLSLFMPGRKNLNIGVKLFSGFSTNEIRACLAHEFGHFSQDSMRLGTMVYVLNTFIRNIVQANNEWDRMVMRLIYFPWIAHLYGIILSLAVKILGWTLYGITYILHWAMKFVAAKVEVDFNRLRRKQEFNADEVAASIVGKEPVISLLCKLNDVERRYAWFLTFLVHLREKGYYVSDFWKTFEQFNEHVTQKTGRPFSYNHYNDKRLSPHPFMKIDVDYLYQSHPSEEQRITRIESLDCPLNISEDTISAMTLLPETSLTAFADKMQRYVFNDNHTEPTDLTLIEDDKLQAFIVREVSWMTAYYAFAGDILEFDLNLNDEATVISQDEEQNRNAVQLYQDAKLDLQLAKELVTGRTRIHHVNYDGVEYTHINELPITQIEDRLTQAAKTARHIQKYYFIQAIKNGNGNEEQIRENHQTMLVIQEYLKFYDETLLPMRINVEEAMGNYRGTSEQFMKLCETLSELQENIKQNMKSFIGTDVLHFSSQEEVEIFNQFLNSDNFGYSNESISGQDVQFLLYTYDLFKVVLNRTLWDMKFQIMQSGLYNIKSDEISSGGPDEESGAQKKEDTESEGSKNPWNNEYQNEEKQEEKKHWGNRRWIVPSIVAFIALLSAVVLIGRENSFAPEPAIPQNQYDISHEIDNIEQYVIDETNLHEGEVTDKVVAFMAPKGLLQERALYDKNNGNGPYFLRFYNEDEFKFVTVMSDLTKSKFTASDLDELQNRWTLDFAKDLRQTIVKDDFSYREDYEIWWRTIALTGDTTIPVLWHLIVIDHRDIPKICFVNAIETEENPLDIQSLVNSIRFE